MSINKYVMSLVVAGTLLSSCDKLKDFGDTNNNPNGSSEVLTSALLTNVEATIGGLAASLQPGLYCQYFAEATYPGNSLYSLPQLNSSGNYSGVLMDCQLIINKNTDPATSGTNYVTSGGAAENQIATANILKSYIYWTMTDRWGNLPYSEALQGVAIINPKYDAQEDIYKGILNTLTQAIGTFDASKVAVKGDIIYNGDVAKWRKLANSLRMLVALRMSKRYPGASEFAAQQFAAAYSDANGHITANSDNFTLTYPGGNYRNPWSTQGASADNAVSKTFTDALAGLSDTRINAMASNTNGVPYGLAVAAPTTPAQARILAAGYRTEASPLVIVSAASVWLAKAEAIELGWITGDSKVAYETGVTRSFEQWGLTVPATYLTTGPANFNSGAGVSSIGGSTVPGTNATTTSKLARIALQQWIAYYPDGTQGWSNWRRSNYIVASPASGVPNLRPTVNYKNSSGQIVRRYVYGVSEYSLNFQKLTENIATMQGGDTQDTHVWWDK